MVTQQAQPFLTGLPRLAVADQGVEAGGEVWSHPITPAKSSSGCQYVPRSGHNTRTHHCREPFHLCATQGNRCPASARAWASQLASIAGLNIWHVL